MWRKLGWSFWSCAKYGEFRLFSFVKPIFFHTHILLWRIYFYWRVYDITIPVDSDNHEHFSSASPLQCCLSVQGRYKEHKRWFTCALWTWFVAFSQHKHWVGSTLAEGFPQWTRTTLIDTLFRFWTTKINVLVFVIVIVHRHCLLLFTAA